MDASDSDEKYFVYDNRLTSFQLPQLVSKRRTSNANGSRVAKKISWPHASPTPSELAKAGFYFSPHPDYPDNVRCFLCRKDMDGWQKDDNPIKEHLDHSNDCGWALCAAIEAGLGAIATDDPRLPHLLAARKATFAGLWPYEAKKGWKCKTKQLAEAGWIYTPSLESDDNTTCAYCDLALDGWESGDKPMDEHKRRSPNCPFFTLIEQYPAPKKSARAKTARASKVSRLSMQSTFSDTMSLADPEDSIMTAVSTATQSSRKTARPKKATSTAKGRKTRVKKDGPVEIHEDKDVEPAEPAVQPTPPAPSKLLRGKKRPSVEMETAHGDGNGDYDNGSSVEAPAPKKRAIKGRASRAVHPGADDSMVSGVGEAGDSNYSMFDPAPIVPDEAEIDAELRALETDMTLGESLAEFPMPKKGRKAGTRKVSRQTKRLKEVAPPAQEEEGEEFVTGPIKPVPATVTPVPVPVLPATRQTVPKPEPLSKPVTELQPQETVSDMPAKATKSKAKETKAKARQTGKAAAAATTASALTQKEKAFDPHDASVVTENSATAVNCKPDENPAPPPKRGRGRPSKKSMELLAAAGNLEISIDFTTKGQEKGTEKGTAYPAPSEEEPQQHQQQLPLPPSTPRAQTSPAGAAKQPVLSPSQSPQTSDAENQPPSSKPASSTAAASDRMKRLVPTIQAQAQTTTVSTPVRGGGAAMNTSPSKRNNAISGGLRSAKPWTSVDVDAVFDAILEATMANKENSGLLRPGMELNTVEKTMTVEEFIFHNANRAERLLKEECEAMVSLFEQQGSKAMQVLESVLVEE